MPRSYNMKEFSKKPLVSYDGRVRYFASPCQAVASKAGASKPSFISFIYSLLSFIDSIHYD